MAHRRNPLVNNIDVTEQIRTAANPRRIHMIIECTMEPETFDFEEGSDVDIDGWNSEDHDLPMTGVTKG